MKSNAKWKGIHPVSLRGPNSQLVNGQLNQGKYIFKEWEMCAPNSKGADSSGKRERKRAGKRMEYKKSFLPRRE